LILEGIIVKGDFVEYQTMINIGAGSALAVMGWFARQLWDAVNELKGDLAKLREEIAKDYVPKNDFKDFTKDIKEMFIEIRDKLDRKVDK
jgi:hypothetical protein